MKKSVIIVLKADISEEGIKVDVTDLFEELPDVHVPEYIIDKVDYYFYDKDNELITDWDLMNTPWFCPHENLNIVSSLISNFSVYLAAYKTFINGMGASKNLGYKTAHWVDYDAVFTDYSDFYDNTEKKQLWKHKLYLDYWKNIIQTKLEENL